MSDSDEEDELGLVVRLVWQVVRKSPFPPPDGHGSWTIDAVTDQAVNLYLAKGAAVVAEAKAAAGGDQGHLERRLLKTIRNYMIDVAKSTPVGLMRNRLATMLLRHPDYVRLDDSTAHPLDGWAPARSPGADGELWHGDEDVLHVAAANTQVLPGVKFNKSGPPPPVTKQALLAVIAAVFAAAGDCYLPDQTLARVVARRFDEFLDPDNRDVNAGTQHAGRGGEEVEEARGRGRRFVAQRPGSGSSGDQSGENQRGGGRPFHQPTGGQTGSCLAQRTAPHAAGDAAAGQVQRYDHQGQASPVHLPRQRQRR